MYRSFYGLKLKPFTLKPDGNCLYLSDTHEEAIANLLYGVNAEKGFLMLTGGIGNGKTTVLNALLAKLDDKVHVCLINNPNLEVQEFYHYAAGLLGLHYENNKGEFIIAFLDLLDRCAGQDEKILLIIDDAQSASIDLMEEVRLLSNHAGNRNVLSIFLVGQPELNEVLAHERLLPLRQRIELCYHLSELTKIDTARYISYRLNYAGAANDSIFTTDAIDSIHHATQGNPRLINVLCDRALIAGYWSDTSEIGSEIVAECLREIRLPEELASQTKNTDDNLGEYSASADADRTKKPDHQLRNISLTLLLLILLSSALFFSLHKGWFPYGRQSSTINIGTLEVR